MASVKRLQRLPAGAENNLTQVLNDALLGGEQYPVTTMIGGIVAGVVTDGDDYIGQGLGYRVYDGGTYLLQYLRPPYVY